MPKPILKNILKALDEINSKTITHHSPPVTAQSRQNEITNITSLATIILAVISLCLTIKAMNTDVSIRNLDSLITNQQKQLAGQDTELVKLGDLQDTTVTQLSEIRKLDVITTKTNSVIQKELKIISSQQRQQLKQDTLARRANLIKLKYFITETYSATQLQIPTTADTLTDRPNFLNSISSNFEAQLTNPILLEDDSLLEKFTYVIYKAQLLSRESVTIGGRHILYYSFYPVPFMGTKEQANAVFAKQSKEFSTQLLSTINYTFKFIKTEFEKLNIPIEPLHTSIWAQ